jgi:hypothetical protein
LEAKELKAQRKISHRHTQTHADIKKSSKVARQKLRRWDDEKVKENRSSKLKAQSSGLKGKPSAVGGWRLEAGPAAEKLKVQSEYKLNNIGSLVSVGM